MPRRVCSLWLAALGLHLAVEAAAWEAPSPNSPFEGQTISSIALVGNNVTKDYVILRELRLKQGGPYKAEFQKQDLVSLANLGIFSSIQVVPEPDTSGVAVTVTVKEITSLVPFPALGYSDQDGWSFGLGIASVNLFGRNIKASGSVLVGGVSTGQLSFNYPWIAGNHLSLDAVAARLERDDKILNYRETSYEVTPWVGTYLGRHGRLRGGFSYFNLRSDQPGITISPTNRDELWRFGLGLGFDNRDSWRVPTSGWRAELLAANTGLLGGDGDSWLSELSVERYVRLSAKNALLLNGLFSFQSGRAGIDVPNYLLYHMGGSNTIRGYKIEELGSQLFGKNQIILTAEYLYTLLPLREVALKSFSFDTGLRTAVFFDYGNAWSKDGEYTWGRGRYGYGAGLRLLLPGVNEVRFDFGVSELGDVVFHIGAGFKADDQRSRLR